MYISFVHYHSVHPTVDSVILVLLSIIPRGGGYPCSLKHNPSFLWKKGHTYIHVFI